MLYHIRISPRKKFTVDAKMKKAIRSVGGTQSHYYAHTTYDWTYFSDTPTIPLSGLNDHEKYVEVIGGKYKGSVGEILAIVGSTYSSRLHNYSLKVRFADKKIVKIGHGHVAFLTDIATTTPLTVFIPEEQSKINHLGQTIEKGIHGLVFCRAENKMVYALIDSVTNNKIKYKSTDRVMRFVNTADMVYVFPDQEKAKTMYAKEVLIG